MDRTAACFKFVNDNWPDEYYKNCIEEWDSIKSFIDEKDNHNKCKCGTSWKHDRYLCKIEEVCPACDKYIQPFLSNPLNSDYVVSYIDRKHWKHIFPIYRVFNQIDDPMDILDIDPKIIPGDLCFAFKQNSEYGTCILSYDRYGNKMGRLETI